MKHEELPLEPVAGMVGLMIIQCRTFNIMYILGLICTNKLIKNTVKMHCIIIILYLQLLLNLLLDFIELNHMMLLFTSILVYKSDYCWVS